MQRLGHQAAELYTEADSSSPLETRMQVVESLKSTLDDLISLPSATS